MRLHLDTTTVSAFLAGDELARFVLGRAPRLALSPIVQGELEAGFLLGKRRQENQALLAELLASPRVEVPALDGDATHRYARIWKQLRADGHPIPTNDLWIAALVDGEGGDALFSHDLHFDRVDGLRVVRDRDAFVGWLTGPEPTLGPG